MKENFYKDKWIQIFLMIFIATIITSFINSLIQGFTYFLFLISFCFVWIYILFKIKKLKKFGLTLIIMLIIWYISFMNFPALTPVFTIFPLIYFITYSQYIFPLLGIVSIVLIYYKKQIFANILFLILLILFLNNIFVFYYNQNYHNIHPYQITMISINDENHDSICKNEVFNESLLSYKYHTPKSNPILPTLGIRYKETYEEERGIVVIYEKRSYFNLYIGNGRVLCDHNGDFKTLE